MGATAPYFPTKYGSRYGLKLDLGNNRLGDAVASDLAELLPFLSELDLTGNRLGDAGARSQHVLHVEPSANGSRQKFLSFRRRRAVLLNLGLTW